MRKLIVLALTAPASAPMIGLAALQASAPVLADTPGQGPACVSQSLNPHPTDPAGGTTATLFCTTPTPTPTANEAGPGGNGSTGSGSGSTGTGTGGGTAAGGGQTGLAGSTGSGTTKSAPDESFRFNRASNRNGSKSAVGRSASGTGIFGGLVGFLSTTGGIAALFGMLLLLLLILAVIAVMGWLRPGQGKNWSSRFSRLTFRA